MLKSNFKLIPINSRITEFKNTHDIDIIRYSLQRTVGLTDDELNQVKIEASVAHRSIEISSTPSIILKILNIFNSLGMIDGFYEEMYRNKRRNIDEVINDKKNGRFKKLNVPKVTVQTNQITVELNYLFMKMI